MECRGDDARSDRDTRKWASVLAHEELPLYFSTAEADAGLRGGNAGSWVTGAKGVTWAPIGGGSPDPEGRMLSLLGDPAKRARIARGARVARALAALPVAEPGHATVLFARWGGIDWVAQVDADFGRGMGGKVAKRLGLDLLGVALLTRAVREGHAAEPTAPGHRRGRVATSGDYLVRVCLAKGEGRPAAIREEAQQLLRAAEAAYLEARAATDEGFRLPAPATAAQRAPRVRTYRAQAPSLVMGGSR